MNDFNKNKISEKIKDWVKKNLSLEKKYGLNQLKDVNYKTGSNFNLNIYNIGAINVGNKTNYVSNIGSRTLPAKSIYDSSANSFYNSNSFGTIYSRFDLIRELYNKQNLGNVFDESIRLLKDLMDQIAQIYNFKCNNLDTFLVMTSNLYLRKKFLLYDEFKEINEAQKDNLSKYHTPTKELVNAFYKIIEKIIYKLKNKWNDNLSSNFNDFNDCYLTEEKEAKKNW